MARAPIMQLPLHVILAAELGRKHPRRGHAAQPGSGPAGETCRSCRHAAAVRHASTYWKCGLMAKFWTGGAATDIKLGDPACARWQAVEAEPAEPAP